MKTKYINIDESLFDEGYSITQALLISYLKRFQQNGKYCYQTKKQIADFFNVSESTIRRELKDLESKGIIFTSTEKKHIPVTFNNRKAIVYVDKKNKIIEPIKISNVYVDEVDKDLISLGLNPKDYYDELR